MVRTNDAAGVPSSVEEQVTAFIERELLGPGERLDPKDDLLSGEVLDSVAVLRLAAYVEEQFDIALRPADFVAENFQTVAAIGSFVRGASRDATDP